ncbi:MAG: efflux RND transporter permease subunit [Alphaproteobacteria bacterium]|nr:efflux RND transporter permease subunit [Alphaproteobacteria bacterium]
MNTLIRAATDHARVVLSLLAMILIGGVSAYNGIPKEAAPDVPIPILYVAMNHTGISPGDAERLLVRPMEQELRGIEGVKEMRSTAYEGGANVLLEFEAGFDPDQALSDVRERVDLAKGELPEDADDPVVKEVNISLFPIIVVALSGEVPERALLGLARKLERELEGIDSVLEVDIAGERDERVEILIDPARLESYGLNALDLVSFVSRSNRVVAAGALDTGRGRFAIKVPGLLADVNEVLDLPVKVRDDAVVRLRDVAEGRRAFADPEGFARVDGRPAIALQVSKRIGTNIIETVDKVRAVVARESAAWPPNVRVAFMQDQSVEIKNMLTDLQNNVISSIVLVLVVVVGALGVRTGGLVGLAIPGSFLMGFLVLAALGLTINMVVLFSLILAAGMLVDGAIVVTELADRKMIEGVPRREAYIHAGQRMAWPVISSTLTTLAAFLPLLFWTGTVGQFMKYLPITLLATLSASLLMALVFVPCLGAIMGAPGTADASSMRAITAGETGDLSNVPGYTGVYVRLLRLALAHPGKVVLGAVASLIAVQVAYGAFGRGVEFFPDVEPEQAIVQVHARGNLSVHEKDDLLRQVESRILGIQGIDTVYARSGLITGSGQDLAEDVIGLIQLELADWRARPKGSAILAEVRARTADLPGLVIEVRKPEAGPPVGKPVQVQLSARDPALLEAATPKVRALFDATPGLADVEDSRAVPGIQWEFVVDRAQAAKYGADVTAIGDVVKLVTKGLKFADYRPDDSTDEVDIVARFPQEYRNLEQLRRLRVPAEAGPVPMGNFVEIAARPKVGQLRRVDGQRVETVKADVAPGVLPDDKVQAIRAGMRTLDLPAGIDWTFKGEDEEQKKSQDFLGKAFTVALFMIALILVTQFNSFYSSFLILSAVIMSTLGVMLGLLIVGQPFGIIMSGIGVISLAGIVVNNNIVLIDTYDRLKLEGDDIQAILRTGAQRLRPVMLTTVTTILGLIPMVFGVSIDFVTREITVGGPSTQWWTQLAVAVAFGLAFATILTLFVTPAALMLRINARRFWRERALRRAAPLAEEGGPAE